MSQSSQQHAAVGLSIERLSKSFPGHTQKVLDDVSFKVIPGEIFVIMGPSGSGKSVLLKTIIGLETADEGQVLIEGHDASLHETHERFVTSMVFQAAALFNSLNVFENLAFYPREHRLYTKSDLNDRVHQTLKMLNLNNCATKMPSELSGGMRKRVAIARALMMEPQLLLYDEPTSELDPISSAIITEVIATLRQTFDVTSVVVSHDRELALSIADRVGILMNGQLVTICPPSELAAFDNAAIQEFLNPKIDLKNPRFKSLIQV